MTDPLDVSLHDSDLRDEVDLTARLIVAANESASVLSQQEIDELLGIPRQR